jgi:hypothetical protein
MWLSSDRHCASSAASRAALASVLVLDRGVWGGEVDGTGVVARGGGGGGWGP